MIDSTRDNRYLSKLMYDLWDNYFCDVPRKNFVLITFGKYSRRQLGCIKNANEKTKVKKYIKNLVQDIEVQDEKSISVIIITRYFKDIEVPEFVIKATIAHELCHYTHGFNSPLPRLYNHPHKGSVVKKELKSRGLWEITKDSEIWLKENWSRLVREYEKGSQM